MTENRWAELGQVGFAALDHAAAVRAATDLLGLALTGELCHTLIRFV